MAVKTGAVLARGRRFPDASIHVMSKTCEGYALLKCFSLCIAIYNICIQNPLTSATVLTLSASIVFYGRRLCSVDVCMCILHQ